MKIKQQSEFKYSYLLGKSAKIDKSDKYSKYKNFIMYLSPYDISGVNICPNASKGCAAACLNMAGRGKFNNVQNARLQRTLHYLSNRVEFLRNLRAEILYHATINDKIAIRLNGTSDLNFNSFIKKMTEVVPHVVWYDYTKNIRQAIKSLTIPNYHITFSRSETNDVDCMKALSLGINVAVVFRKELPSTWNGFKVIDGDISDTRFLDKSGVVIGLRAKGPAKKDTSGFVVD